MEKDDKNLKQLPLHDRISFTVVSGNRGQLLKTITVNPEPVISDHKPGDQENHAEEPLPIKRMLYFCPNGENIERWPWRFELLANSFQVPVTLFNYSGVGNSSYGNWEAEWLPCIEDLVDDGVAQVFALLANDPNLQLDEIELYGASLGGAIATGVASKMAHYCQHPEEVPETINRTNIRNRFKKNAEPYLFSDRSFSAIGHVVMAYLIGSQPGRRTPLEWIGFAARLLLVSPLVLICYLVLFLSKTDFYAGWHFAWYPKNKKNYADIRSPSVFRGYPGKGLTMEGLHITPVEYPTLTRTLDPEDHDMQIMELSKPGEIKPTVSLSRGLADDGVILPVAQLGRSPFVFFSKMNRKERRTHMYTPITENETEQQVLPTSKDYRPEPDQKGEIQEKFVEKKFHNHPADKLMNRENDPLTTCHLRWLREAGKRNSFVKKGSSSRLTPA